LASIVAANMQVMDLADFIPDIQRAGKTYVARYVTRDHLRLFA